MRWNVLQGLVFGLIAGIVLAASFLWDGWGYISLILIPLGVVMGVLPQVLKSGDDDERRRRKQIHGRARTRPFF